MTETPTRLQPPKRGTYTPVEGLALKVYSEYMGMLSLDAWRTLGEPPAIAFDLDERGYSIVAAQLGEATAVRLHQNRKASLGVITDALRGAEFPLQITLIAEDGRLRFGTIRSTR